MRPDALIFRIHVTDGRQHIVFNGEKSPSTSINLGVPQDSVLGPTLITKYISDITNIFAESTSILIADDMAMYLTCQCS